jgi:hypothetical protein
LGVFKAPWILARVSSKLDTQSWNFRGSGVSRTSLISGGYEDTPPYWFTMYMSQTTKHNKDLEIHKQFPVPLHFGI